MNLPAWQPHPEVWLLVASLAGLGWYAARVIGPKAVPPGEPITTRRQRTLFVLGLLSLWLASDWPLHDVAEEQLYTVHMVQHFLLTMVVPPLFLLATPSWLAELLVTNGGRPWTWLRRLAHPVTATVLFNAVTIATHYTIIVNTSARVGAFHYLVHVVVVSTAVLMWIPVCGPWRELRLRSAPAVMVYLFIQSIVPTVPGAWLTLAEGPVYEVYDHEKMWHISTVEDQQAAGLFMKVFTGSYLWLLIVVIFFRWAYDALDKDQKPNVLSESEVRVIEALRSGGSPEPAAVGSSVTGSGPGGGGTPPPGDPPLTSAP